MERHFEHDLEQLKERLLVMAGLAERAVHQSVQAVFQKNETLANRVLEEEPAINEMQIEIDDRVMQLVAPSSYGGRLAVYSFRLTHQQRS